jgi:hypothetical protein
VLLIFLGLALAAGIFVPSHAAQAAVAHAKSDAGSCGNSAHAGNMGSICSNGASSQSFTYTPGAANDGVLLEVGCAAASTPSAVSLSASNWTFTQVGSNIGSAGNWSALFKAYSPNASQATVADSWTVSGGCSRSWDIACAGISAGHGMCFAPAMKLTTGRSWELIISLRRGRGSDLRKRRRQEGK